MNKKRLMEITIGIIIIVDIIIGGMFWINSKKETKEMGIKEVNDIKSNDTNSQYSKTEETSEKGIDSINSQDFMKEEVDDKDNIILSKECEKSIIPKGNWEIKDKAIYDDCEIVNVSYNGKVKINGRAEFDSVYGHDGVTIHIDKGSDLDLLPNPKWYPEVGEYFISRNRGEVPVDLDNLLQKKSPRDVRLEITEISYGWEGPPLITKSSVIEN